MKVELEDKLIRQYPKLFNRKKCSIFESCMAWGCQCGDGWFELLGNLCEALQSICDQSGVQAEFTEVKEKFGYLRTSIAVRYTWKFWKRKDFKKTYKLLVDLCWMFESYSGGVCEYCGERAVGTTQGYMTRLCSPCAAADKREFRLDSRKQQLNK